MSTCCDNIAQSIKKTIVSIGMAVGARAHTDTVLLSTGRSTISGMYGTDKLCNDMHRSAVVS